MNTDKNRSIHGHNVTRCIFILVVCIAMAFIPACSFKGVQDSSYLTDQRFPPKPANAPIDILTEKPTTPYILIGEVSAWADVPFMSRPQAQNAINKIKTMAREMGGDAIMNYQGHRAPAGTVGAGGFTAQGVVIRWK